MPFHSNTLHMAVRRDKIKLFISRSIRVFDLVENGLYLPHIQGEYAQDREGLKFRVRTAAPSRQRQLVALIQDSPFGKPCLALPVEQRHKVDRPAFFFFIPHSVFSPARCYSKGSPVRTN